ncbi:MAG: hypothetical protein QF554_07285 [Dehalococcoidia bacterium]|nr:hypothetical protein [Dehalococcoidia bacterium]
MPADTAVATGVDVEFPSGVGSAVAVDVAGTTVEVETGVAVAPSPEELQAMISKTAINTAIAPGARYVYPAGPALEVNICGK